jgi:hypothetical protein
MHPCVKTPRCAPQTPLRVFPARAGLRPSRQDQSILSLGYPNCGASGKLAARSASADVPDLPHSGNSATESLDEASFFIKNLRALPWQRAAVWTVVVAFALQLSDFFGVRPLSPSIDPCPPRPVQSRTSFSALRPQEQVMYSFYVELATLLVHARRLGTRMPFLVPVQLLC